MKRVANAPLLVFVLSLAILWLAERIGALLRWKGRPLEEEDRKDFDVVLAATLTLLGLIIGFSFSMVINRYDQRKNYEEDEANAVGTEFVRADLLSTSDAAQIKGLLKKYLDQRLLFYTITDTATLKSINAQTTQLQAALWSAVRQAIDNQPTPIAALVVSGMNDVLNSQGYTQAAWSNRLPIAAWGLLVTIGVLCNLLIGYCSRRGRFTLTLILPLAVSVSFFLIADIDSPSRGLIRVYPQNLLSLARSLNGE